MVTCEMMGSSLYYFGRPLGSHFHSSLSCPWSDASPFSGVGISGRGVGDDKFISCLLDVVYWVSGSFHVIQVGLAVLDRGIRCVTAGYKLKFEQGESPALYKAVTQHRPYPVGWPLPPPWVAILSTSASAY